MENENNDELRLKLADEPKLDDDPAPPVRMRYIFTVVMPVATVPDNALAAKVHLTSLIDKINDQLKPERVGLVAVMEDGHVTTVDGR